MNFRPHFSSRALAVTGAIGVALAALTLAPAAHARSNVYWSVGVNAPGVGVGVTNAYPVYTAPAPVYVQPRPVYVQPQPVYAPPPVYYTAPPVVVTPAPVYPIGWGPRGYYRHHHHRHWRGDGWRH